jgi:hypothetical protein
VQVALSRRLQFESNEAFNCAFPDLPTAARSEKVDANV